MKIKISIGLSFLLFLYFFIVCDTTFRGPDDAIYFAYITSVMEDGDLNIVNQYYSPFDIFIISPTYNLPDFHNHGGVLLWMPFYAYANFINYIATKLNLLTIDGHESLIRCAMSFSTIVFGFFTILLTYMLCRVFFSNKIAIWSTLAIFLGTPFFYYALYEPGNANMVACLFSILSIWFCSYAIGMKKLHWFLYGVFFSICMVIKVDLWFQIFFILSLFFILLRRKQATWTNGVYFLTGLLPILILKTINDYIKYGTLHIGEAGPMTFKSFYFFGMLFSSYHGFFYTSPIFYICLLGFVFAVIYLSRDIRKDGIKNLKEKSMKDFFLFSLSVYLFMKMFIIAWKYAWGGGTCGARPLLTEFPVFVLLYARALQMNKKNLMYFITIISVLCVFWNFLVISEFVTGADMQYIEKGFPELIVRIKSLKFILIPLLYIKDKDLVLKLKLYLPLILAVLGITFYIKTRFAKPIHPSFWYSKRQNNRKPLKLFSLVTIYLCIVYTTITLLNVSNTRRNVEKLKANGFFKNAKIVSPRYFDKEENVSSLDEMIWYFGARGDIDRVGKIKKLKKELYNE